jgi:hypothetical protein
VLQRRLGIEEKHSIGSRGKLDTTVGGLTQHLTQPPHPVHTVCTTRWLCVVEGCNW